MSSQPARAADASATAAARSALRLTRGVSATWWYMALAIVFSEAIIVALSVAVVADAGSGALAPAGVAAAGLIWWLATLFPLAAYRHRPESAPLAIWRYHLPPLLTGVVYGLAGGLTADLWTLGAIPVLQAAMLLNWPPGVRLRVVLASTALLIGLAVIDGHLALEASRDTGVFQLLFLAGALPLITVSSLWWWDVLVALDRARTSEARLAATQERLRLATDVHDLQGHHLQVIALQLELAERLMPRDAGAGMEQLRAARVSVDAARQGTRDLATRFRSVPLGDEIANAVDLLRAAGTSAESAVDPAASQAPTAVLGPVIRETTTNVLRHGGGRWARLQLSRSHGWWRYEISNDVGGDVAADTTAATDGSGLAGVARRAGEAGGDLEVRRDGGAFTVTVTVPEEGEETG